MGNLAEYTGDVSTPTAGIYTDKMILNSVIFTPKAHFITVNIKSFYLETPLDDPEYMHLHLVIFTEAFKTP